MLMFSEQFQCDEHVFWQCDGITLFYWWTIKTQLPFLPGSGSLLLHMCPRRTYWNFPWQRFCCPPPTLSSPPPRGLIFHSAVTSSLNQVLAQDELNNHRQTITVSTVRHVTFTLQHEPRCLSHIAIIQGLKRTSVDRRLQLIPMLISPLCQNSS